ncbi:MAG TPA: CBS domain-containing protein [Pyrinomonadaceae bacterium]|nr:CBS domain-containing protein [Pyrinomonadaceae bacterium]
MITIGDVIRDREPYFVRDTATALDAAEYMMSRNIGAVCVLNEEGKLSGIFSERDLLRRVVLQGKQPADVPINDVMSQIEVVIDCSDTPHEALERMEKYSTRHLPVVKGERWVGMLSIRDIMRVELSERGDELRLLHEYMQM